ncbi:hypothetical protein PFISCL1PPCAC_25635, partial [Pristionchus fissidentatus]
FSVSTPPRDSRLAQCPGCWRVRARSAGFWARAPPRRTVRSTDKLPYPRAPHRIAGRGDGRLGLAGSRRPCA